MPKESAKLTLWKCWHENRLWLTEGTPSPAGGSIPGRPSGSHTSQASLPPSVLSWLLSIRRILLMVWQKQYYNSLERKMREGNLSVRRVAAVTRADPVQRLHHWREKGEARRGTHCSPGSRAGELDVALLRVIKQRLNGKSAKQRLCLV